MLGVKKGDVIYNNDTEKMFLEGKWKQYFNVED